MSTVVSVPKPDVVYPESDGRPRADNTKHFRWIVTIQGGLDSVFRNDPDVFVAANLLWYPVQGDNTIRVAPYIFVVFGRPKGDRGSYMQWEEGNIAPQVTWEIVSPGNRAAKLTTKFSFYKDYGVEEYYLYDPDSGDLNGWLRKGSRLLEIPKMNGWTSPRLNIRFGHHEGVLHLYGPDGQPFATYVELVEQREVALAEKEKERAEKEKAQRRAEQLAEQLKALGVEPKA